MTAHRRILAARNQFHVEHHQRGGEEEEGVKSSHRIIREILPKWARCSGGGGARGSAAEAEEWEGGKLDSREGEKRVAEGMRRMTMDSGHEEEETKKKELIGM